MSSCLLITTFNRSHLLAGGLRHLAGAGHTLPDEILVVDDGGTDGCENVVSCLRDEFGLPLRYLYTHNPAESQCSHARNVGIKNTDCDVIITSEPEMLFETDVVAQLLASHVAATSDEIVSAGTVLHEQPPGHTCFCCNEPVHTTINWSATWIALYRRDWLLDIGGWDEDWPDPWGWEDVDLCTRLRVRGVGQRIDLDIVARHQWHPPRQCNQERNEAHFRSKGYHMPEDSNHPDLFANTGREWGVLIPRP